MSNLNLTTYISKPKYIITGTLLSLITIPCLIFILIFSLFPQPIAIPPTISCHGGLIQETTCYCPIAIIYCNPHPQPLSAKQAHHDSTNRTLQVKDSTGEGTSILLGTLMTMILLGLGAALYFYVMCMEDRGKRNVSSGDGEGELVKGIV